MDVTRDDYELLISEIEGVAKAGEIIAEIFPGTQRGEQAWLWSVQVRNVIANFRKGSK